jgi:hypothetical protein
MAFNLQSIQSGAVIRAPRMILLGVEKIGKTTFASGADNPVFLPIKQEEGVDAISSARFPTAMTFDDVMQAIASLYQEQHEFRTLVIDSASALEPVIWESVCADFKCDSIEKVGGGFGKGYTEAMYKWRDLMNALDALRSHKGMASILIGHVMVKRFDDPLGESYDQYQFDVNAKAANALYRWSDAIVFANTKTAVRKEEVGFNKEKKRGVDVTGNRYLFTRKTPAHPGGGRGVYGQLPYELPLQWSAYSEAVANAINNNNNQ